MSHAHTKISCRWFDYQFNKYKRCFITETNNILMTYCDRTTSEMRGLPPKIILRDSRRSENAQTHTQANNTKYEV
jgi:hypothetical protein